MGIAWDTYGAIFAEMGVTETQFATFVKNRKASFVPLVQAQKQAVTDKAKGLIIVNSILESVGAANAGGYDTIARDALVPQSHVEDIDRALITLVVEMNSEGAFDD